MVDDDDDDAVVISIAMYETSTGRQVLPPCRPVLQDDVPPLAPSLASFGSGHKGKICGWTLHQGVHPHFDINR